VTFESIEQHYVALKKQRLALDIDGGARCIGDRLKFGDANSRGGDQRIEVRDVEGDDRKSARVDFLAVPMSRCDGIPLGRELGPPAPEVIGVPMRGDKIFGSRVDGGLPAIAGQGRQRQSDNSPEKANPRHREKLGWDQSQLVRGFGDITQLH